MGQVDASICTCGRTVAPPRRYCPDCQRAMSQLRLNAKGVVITHTTEAVTAEGIEAPVHLAVVRIAEGERGKPPVRILARGEEPFSDGQRVALEARGDVLWAQPA
jgi:uncharacterized OB-fold protein